MLHSLSSHRTLAAWLLIGVLSACSQRAEQRGVYAGVTYLRLQGGLFVWDLPDLSRVEVVPSVLPGVNELVVLDGYGWYKIRFTVFKPMLPGGAHGEMQRWKRETVAGHSEFSILCEDVRASTDSIAGEYCVIEDLTTGSGAGVYRYLLQGFFDMSGYVISYQVLSRKEKADLYLFIDQMRWIAEASAKAKKGRT